MTAVSILVTLLILAAFFTMFGLWPVVGRLSARFDQAEQKRRKIDAITGREPRGLRRRIIQAEQMLASADMGEDWNKYRLMSAILGVLGIVAGMALDNVFVAIVLVPVLAMVPVMAIHIRTAQYIRQTDASAQNAMTVVTNAYSLGEDLIGAVRAALPNLQQPMLGIFRTFLSDVELIDPHVADAIRRMRPKVNNRYWHAWCDTLMECQHNRALRVVLGTILRRMSMTRRMQMELDTIVRNNYVYFIMEMLLVVVVPLLIGMVLPEYAPLLFGSMPGKISLAIAILLLFLSTLRTVQVNRPLDV